MSEHMFERMVSAGVAVNEHVRVSLVGGDVKIIVDVDGMGARYTVSKHGYLDGMYTLDGVQCDTFTIEADDIVSATRQALRLLVAVHDHDANVLRAEIKRLRSVRSAKQTGATALHDAATDDALGHILDGGE